MTTTTTANLPSNLSIVRSGDVIGVEDENGGIWWPSNEAELEIDASDDPEITAILMCASQPMRGTWHD